MAMGTSAQFQLRATVLLRARELGGGSELVGQLEDVQFSVPDVAREKNFDDLQVELSKPFLFVLERGRLLLERELNAGEVDIELFFNEQFCDQQPRWYLGLDVKPAPDQIDFATIALHEPDNGSRLTTRASIYDGQSGDGKLDAYAAFIYDTSVSQFLGRNEHHRNCRIGVAPANAGMGRRSNDALC